MLGWGNVPPRETLERSLRAEHARFEATKEALKNMSEERAELLQAIGSLPQSVRDITLFEVQNFLDKCESVGEVSRRIRAMLEKKL